MKIVVAINKVDLPNANVRRTEQQLYGMGLIPDSMGGDCQFVYTSAATGRVSMNCWKPWPGCRSRGTQSQSRQIRKRCLPGIPHFRGQGVIATIIVQEGTLRRGDIVLCGAAFGRVRAMYDDAGKQIQEAGPSEPVRLLGLDEVPNADDPFVVVPELAKAREISEKRKQKAVESSQIKRQSLSFDSLGGVGVTELKVILKADFRGSLEAIRKEIEKLQHDEVKVRVLHTGVGAITEGDVQLALTSPTDTMILGFNAEPDNRALALSEERGIPIRSYSIIYKLTEDVKSRLEGRLKPKEEVIRLGRAVIREVFKISRVGAIAGCVVTQGIIERSAKVRVIRSGVVVYPPAERTASLESLKRFKDDVREVREGYECGMKIAGYDDIKVDDVIEAFKIEQFSAPLIPSKDRSQPRCDGLMEMGGLRVRLRVRESRSLKDKRQVVQSIKEKLRQQFLVSASEVDALDSWQLAVLGFSLVGNDRAAIRQTLDQIVSALRVHPKAEMIDHDIQFMDWKNRQGKEYAVKSHRSPGLRKLSARPRVRRFCSGCRIPV